MDNRKRLTRFIRLNPGVVPPANMLAGVTRNNTRSRSLRRAYLFANSDFESNDRAGGRLLVRDLNPFNDLSPGFRHDLAVAVQNTQIPYVQPERLRRRGQADPNSRLGSRS